MSDIFISYGREDRGLAERLAHAFEAQGWSVWWDRAIPAGREFAAVIEEQIEAARCVIVLWSTTSIQSRWVRTEASAALERDILVPVLVEPVHRLPLAFRQLQTANLARWNGSHEDVGFQQIVSGVLYVLALSAAAVSELESLTDDVRPKSEPPKRPLGPAGTAVSRGSRLPLHRGSTAFSESDELVVPTSRGKLFSIALVSAAFVVTGVWMFYIDTEVSARITGGAAAIFGVCGAYAAWRLIHPTPALVVNREGVFDNASAVGTGLIRWDEIDDLRAYHYMGQVFLGVFLKNRDAFLARQPLWKRQFLRANRYLGAAPVNIPQVVLPITIAELLREIAVRSGNEVRAHYSTCLDAREI